MSLSAHFNRSPVHQFYSQPSVVALVLPAVVLGGTLRPEAGVSPVGWELRPVFWGTDLKGTPAGIRDNNPHHIIQGSDNHKLLQLQLRLLVLLITASYHCYY